jgi:hypothetical protein
MGESTEFFSEARGLLNEAPKHPTVADAQETIAKVVLAMTGKTLLGIGKKHICLEGHVTPIGTHKSSPYNFVVEALRSVFDVETKSDAILD